MIKCKVICFQLVSLVVLTTASRQILRPARSSVSDVADSQQANTDAISAETGFAGAVQAGSKYFQYAHVPAKDHYEVGHKRGNDHHFIERHEKAHPHEGEFKTKVRWGDKHGGYGEHYWDYNHSGHDDHGEETQNHEQYVPYEPETTATKSGRQRRSAQDDVEFIDEQSKSRILNGVTGKHGGNYRRLPELERSRRHYFDY